MQNNYLAIRQKPYISHKTITTAYQSLSQNLVKTTYRIIQSYVASIYNPLGLIFPIHVLGKDMYRKNYVG